MPQPPLDNSKFRLAMEREMEQHHRSDREQYPYIYYVAYVVITNEYMTSTTNYGWRFMFTAHQIKTPRNIQELISWLEQYAGSREVMLQSFQEVEEELP